MSWLKRLFGTDKSEGAKKPKYDEELAGDMLAYIRTDTLELARMVVEAMPRVWSDEGIELFDELTKTTRSYMSIRMRRDLLMLCRQHGPVAASNIMEAYIRDGKYQR